MGTSEERLTGMTTDEALYSLRTVLTADRLAAVRIGPMENICGHGQRTGIASDDC